MQVFAFLLRVCSVVLSTLLFCGLSNYPHYCIQAQDKATAPDTDLSLKWELGPTGTKASLRGIVAPSDQIIWACGSGGKVVRSVDAGSSWIECGPEGMTDLEFRSIYAWDDSQACIASAGSPAIILRTKDSGGNWQEVFRHESEKAFFDGLLFWDHKRGIAFSDPVGVSLLVVETEDGGRTWQQVPTDLLSHTVDGEAGFAASNSSMAIGANGHVWIGTGGAKLDQSRVHYRSGWQQKWSVGLCPIPSDASQGIFSIASTPGQLIAVGGDYRPQANSPLTVAISNDDGRTWRAAKRSVKAFRSAVLRLPEDRSRQAVWVTIGPTGSDWSKDGEVWHRFSDFGFHALARGDNSVFAVGSEGRFAILRF